MTTAALRAVMTICQVTQLLSDVTQVIETSVKAAAMEPTGSPPLTGQKKEKKSAMGGNDRQRGNMAHLLWINFPQEIKPFAGA